MATQVDVVKLIALAQRQAVPFGGRVLARNRPIDNVAVAWSVSLRDGHLSNNRQLHTVRLDQKTSTTPGIAVLSL